MTQSTLFTVKAGTCPTYDPDEPSYSPFQNLENSRIRNACHASAEMQRTYFATANMAHAICLWYWASRFWDYPILEITGRPIDRAEAILLLKTFCHRSPEIATLNLERSRYAVAKNRTPSVYGAEVVNSLGAISTALSVVAE